MTLPRPEPSRPSPSPPSPMAAALALAGLLAGCRPGPDAREPPPPGVVAVHATRGVVREIAPDRTTAVIRHEEIPGYMPRMTMELNVRDTNELAGIAAGDEVTFRLLADERTHWIDRVRRIRPGGDGPSATPPATPGAHFLEPGEAMPDEPLRTETGATLHLSELRGSAVAITFIFTRCPLPDYCPLMSRHFAAARDLLRGRENGPANWVFLSVSFDPETDRPEVLRQYGDVYRGGDRDRWVFAVAERDVLARLAPRVDLRLAADRGSIAHNLRTLVLDPAGRVARHFHGNRWTAAELAEAMAAAAAWPP